MFYHITIHVENLFFIRSHSDDLPPLVISVAVRCSRSNDQIDLLKWICTKFVVSRFPFICLHMQWKWKRVVNKDVNFRFENQFVKLWVPKTSWSLEIVRKRILPKKKAVLTGSEVIDKKSVQCVTFYKLLLAMGTSIKSIVKLKLFSSTLWLIFKKCWFLYIRMIDSGTLRRNWLI